MFLLLDAREWANERWKRPLQTNSAPHRIGNPSHQQRTHVRAPQQDPANISTLSPEHISTQGSRLIRPRAPWGAYRQNLSAFSGGSPLPVVDTTSTTALHSGSSGFNCAKRIRQNSKHARELPGSQEGRTPRDGLMSKRATGQSHAHGSWRA